MLDIILFNILLPENGKIGAGTFNIQRPDTKWPLRHNPCIGSKGSKARSLLMEMVLQLRAPQ